MKDGEVGEGGREGEIEFMINGSTSIAAILLSRYSTHQQMFVK